MLATPIGAATPAARGSRPDAAGDGGARDLRRRLPGGPRRALRIAGLLAATTLAGAAGHPGFAGASSAVGAGARSRISVSVSGPVSRERTYDVTISGYARHQARAWVFIDYRRCTGFAAERDRAADESQSYRVRGSFAMTSGWKSARLGTDHACAFLVAPGSGAVVASAAAAYTIS